MELRKDSQYYLILADQQLSSQKVACFYFSDCYSEELLNILKKNKKIASLVNGKIMTHTYFKFITGDLGNLYYHQLCLSRFNIKIRKSTFKVIRNRHTL